MNFQLMAFGFAALFLIALPATCKCDDIREWKSNDNAHTLHGALIEIYVRLKKQDGSFATIATSKLSDSDREYLGKYLYATQIAALNRQLEEARQRIKQLEADKVAEVVSNGERNDRPSKPLAASEKVGPLADRLVAGKFTVSNMSLDREKLIGEVTNETTSFAEHVFLRFSVYDSSGRLFDTESLSVGPIEAGQIKRFDFYLNKVPPNDYRLVIDEDE